MLARDPTFKSMQISIDEITDGTSLADVEKAHKHTIENQKKCRSHVILTRYWLGKHAERIAENVAMCAFTTQKSREDEIVRRYRLEASLGHLVHVGYHIRRSRLVYAILKPLTSDEILNNMHQYGPLRAVFSILGIGDRQA